jgi:hypothetical protein
MPYHHPNHKSHCIAQGIDQQQNQYEYKQHSSYIVEESQFPKSGDEINTLLGNTR